MRTVIALLLLVSAQAHAALIYNWTGDCSVGCVGQATMQLTLKDGFAPNVPFAVVNNVLLGDDASPFLSFIISNGVKTLSYASSSNPFSAISGSGGMLPDQPGFADLNVFFNWPDNIFRERLDGTWDAGFDEQFTMRGTNGVFIQAVPEPATLALLLLSACVFRKVAGRNSRQRT